MPKHQKFSVVLADEEGNVIESWTDCVTEQSFDHFEEKEDYWEHNTFPSWDELNRAAERHENKQ